MIDTAEERLIFTTDWVTQHLRLWSSLIPILPARDKVLEIGAFEGRASCWFLEFLLSKTGSLYCIDTWEGSPEFSKLPEHCRIDTRKRFDHNVAIAKGPEQTVRAMQMRSDQALVHLLNREQHETFDWIYVDGGHSAIETLTDAVMAWPLLKPGGVMVFDDYLWGIEEPVDCRPKFAIDTFTLLWRPQMRTVCCGIQYIVQKTV